MADISINIKIDNTALLEFLGQAGVSKLLSSNLVRTPVAAGVQKVLPYDQAPASASATPVVAETVQSVENAADRPPAVKIDTVRSTEVHQQLLKACQTYFKPVSQAYLAGNYSSVFLQMASGSFCNVTRVVRTKEKLDAWARDTVASHQAMDAIFEQVEYYKASDYFNPGIAAGVFTFLENECKTLAERQQLVAKVIMAIKALKGKAAPGADTSYATVISFALTKYSVLKGTVKPNYYKRYAEIQQNLPGMLKDLRKVEQLSAKSGRK